MTERIPSTAFADAWINVDNTVDPGFFVQLLDATRQKLLERARRSPAEFFAPLDLQPRQRVLDVGCGTGDFLRLLAPLIAPGRAVGVDISETMVAEARRRADSSSPTTIYELGDAQDLAFEGGSFDRVLATQVLLHVPDPGRALAEMSRVLAPGGIMSMAEVDWDTVAVECTNRELGRRFTQLACDQLRNGHIVRELPWRLQDLGFDRVQITASLDVSRDLDAFHQWFIEPSLGHFVRIGGFTEAEADAFRADLRERARLGRYFSSRPYYTVLASRTK
jgi:ubiquinone/menaquinone biosynthesis C-methylase UbiE